MKLEIFPYYKVGPFILKSNITEIEKILGPADYVLKNDYVAGSTFYFKENCIKVDTSDDREVLSLEFSSPFKPYYNDMHFIGLPYKTVKAWFEERDDNVECDGAGLTSEKLGIGVYAESAEKHPEDPVEAVIVFVKDYYKK